MCVLLILKDRAIGWPWVIAANRDEALARPSRPPAAVRGPFRFFAGSDKVAGGTWLGVNERGLVSVITNRPGDVADPRRPSRGHVTVAALLQPDAAAARRLLQDLSKDRCPWKIAGAGPDGKTGLAGDEDLHVEERPLTDEPPEPYNPFNLFVAHGEEGFVTYHDAGPTFVDVEPGVHILTNHHDLDALPADALLDRIGRDRVWRREERDELVATLREALAHHDGVGPDDYRICKHGEEYGTVSSTILAVGPEWPGDALFLHADGKPCETRFTSLSERAHISLG